MSLCISKLKIADISRILNSDPVGGFLYLLPSTMVMLRSLPKIRKKHEKIKVVGDINFFRMHGVEIQNDNIYLPSNFLKICKERSCHSKKPPSVLVNWFLQRFHLFWCVGKASLNFFRVSNALRYVAMGCL